MLKRGELAPDFSLADGRGQITTLAGLLQRGPLLLYFYPADFTPVCTREACLFRDHQNELETAGVQIVGISPDGAESHERFRTRHGLGFTLLADPDKSAIRAYGVDGPFGIGVRRASFLIDADGRIRAAVRADLRLKPHRALIEQALNSQ